jgi:hypothetical protein
MLLNNGSSLPRLVHPSSHKIFVTSSINLSCMVISWTINQIYLITKTKMHAVVFSTHTYIFFRIYSYISWSAPVLSWLC